MNTTSGAITETDEQLAARSARRDDAARRAFEQLYERHAPHLLAFLAARSRDPEDLNQIVWQRVWDKLATQFDGTNFRAWLFGIARNAAIDQGRKKRPEALGEEAELTDRKHNSPVARLLEQERADALRRCLARLGEPAAALVRGKLDGEGYPELCTRLDLKPERAHKLFHQAKTQLHECVMRALR